MVESADEALELNACTSRRELLDRQWQVQLNADRLLAAVRRQGTPVLATADCPGSSITVGRR